MADLAVFEMPMPKSCGRCPAAQLDKCVLLDLLADSGCNMPKHYPGDDYSLYEYDSISRAPYCPLKHHGYDNIEPIYRPFSSD